MQLGLIAKAALAQLVLDEERDLERRRRAFVRHPGDTDDDPPAGEPIERRTELGRCLSRVEVVSLGLEVLDRLGHDAGASGDHEVVILQLQAVGQR